MSGLGKEISEIALKKWYSVDIIDITPSKDEIFLKKVQYIETNLAEISEDICEKLSPVYDMVVCNAGISLSGDYIQHSMEKNTSLMSINTLGHMELIRLLLEKNKLSSWSRIWLVASASEMLPFPIALWYAASKWALRSFAVALRSYLVWRKISVSIIYPWPMPTAHVKYYGKKIVDDAYTRKKVQKIAHKVLRGIEKWKRNIYPDMVSKLLTIFRVFWPILDRVMYKSYKKEFWE